MVRGVAEAGAASERLGDETRVSAAWSEFESMMTVVSTGLTQEFSVLHVFKFGLLTLPK